MEIYAETAMSILDELHTERLDYHSEYVPLADAINRLAAYEDTGLEPEEIVQLKCSVEEIRKEVDTIYDNQIFVKMLRDKGVVDIDSGIQHMQELIAAEEQARLVVLPCKIGDTVYSHARKFDGADYVRGTEFWWSDIPEMGKTVFLTREAAEAALKEREDDLCKS